MEIEIPKEAAKRGNEQVNSGNGNCGSENAFVAGKSLSVTQEDSGRTGVSDPHKHTKYPGSLRRGRFLR
ncbi:MAG TPA: hypothetical protein VLW06_14395, partial [Terriglobales bacterium]|nr:hypothetical protein [Terriglobales bacterium]